MCTDNTLRNLHANTYPSAVHTAACITKSRPPMGSICACSGPGKAVRRAAALSL